MAPHTLSSLSILQAKYTQHELWCHRGSLTCSVVKHDTLLLQVVAPVLLPLPLFNPESRLPPQNDVIVPAPSPAAVSSSSTASEAEAVSRPRVSYCRLLWAKTSKFDHGFYRDSKIQCSLGYKTCKVNKIRKGVYFDCLKLTEQMRSSE